jgi:hypothetical protein
LARQAHALGMADRMISDVLAKPDAALEAREKRRKI